MDAEERQRFAALAKAVADDRDQQAFSILFDYFAPRLKSWLMRQKMTSGEAEELVQEIMIVLWHKAYLYDATRSSLSTWLFRIARNRRIDLRRRTSTRTFDETDPTLLPPAEIGADEIIANGDRDAKLRAAVEQLSEEQRDMLRAAFFLGQSHSEIAEATGLPLGTVKSRIRLAFGKLRKMLEQELR
ncbi:MULTISPECIES: sigma-70 family RNA polymerase sigma factor [Rhizobium]|uniref:sigma-70 family RNA polymerase sigma factor n=1 Tax=Rhizobium TaxID=379 RepID=UPI001B32789F|nr:MULTISPECIES: sigma-70 family RNA polymerase sigma factor [Rhizobium]MBX4907271.1 sigma-70 family RNA polymerase sigma factor [Rhizobium bangladeshense]MBX5215033.1 sigma-70 family RNA polymerase sigma factor [Rhizobium sp. NLR9a]MBX5232198.1 sigma-70 family RNA polymerase sigma factor [Rhizobium sp. NLR4a]MBX5238334.1 sigma-70 family RNA polymerase sigma factor [Rhizobium sp. NLR22b]MBX5244449.1 sigma-70 family RNA polymerase sigma factor [Rhizobium sp. NLR3b]